MNTMLVY